MIERMTLYACKDVRAIAIFIAPQFCDSFSKLQLPPCSFARDLIAIQVGE